MSERCGATVVISLRVKDEHRSDYEAWQEAISAEAAKLDGFEGTELIRPKPGVQDDWVVIYRFDTAQHLAAWMEADVRRELIENAEPFFEESHEHVVATPRGRAQPVTVVVSQKVAAGKEKEYAAWQDGILGAVRKFPGFLESEHFAPVEGVQEDWVVVFRFASADTLDAWLESDVRRQWLDKAEPFLEKVSLQRVGGGLGGWFPSTAEAAAPVAPDWKQAMAVLFALYPTVMLLTMYLWPRLEWMPMPANMFLNNVASVAALTWLFMPLTIRLLGPWLAPKSTAATVVGTLLLSVAFGAMVALFVAVA